MAVTARPKHSLLLEEIGQAVVTGALPPGADLDRGELERIRGVSHSTVREALLVLQAKGLIQVRYGRQAGTCVAPASHWNLLDADVLRWVRATGAPAPLAAQIQAFAQAVRGLEAPLAGNPMLDALLRVLAPCDPEPAAALSAIVKDPAP